MTDDSPGLDRGPNPESNLSYKNLKAVEAADDQYSEITEEQRLKSVETAAKM